MNSRERCLEVALFGKPDKVPLDIWGIRAATRKSWAGQGLPRSTALDSDKTYEYLGHKSCLLRFTSITTYPGEGANWKPSSSLVNLGPIPPFEYKILREDERYRVWVDNLGITQRGFQHDFKGQEEFGSASGFVTRVFMDFPVKNWKDFLEIKKRYDPNDPERYPENWTETVKDLRKRDYPVQCAIRGPFWWTRDMVGLKGLVTGIYAQPDLIKEIMNFCAEFQTESLSKALEDVDVDVAFISEDMAYKAGPMIGPKTVKRFMEKPYKQIVRFFHDNGVKVIHLDSDGNVEPLIPSWFDLGINWLSPFEVAAGMNVVDIGKKYPRLVMSDGIDKRELAKDKKAIYREVMDKVPPLIERGGYFPGVDHATPPDVSYENFKYFISLLKKICRW